jgi:hypothetical protein
VGGLKILNHAKVAVAIVNGGADFLRPRAGWQSGLLHPTDIRAAAGLITLRFFHAPNSG